MALAGVAIFSLSGYLWAVGRGRAGSQANVPWLHSNGIGFVDRSDHRVLLRGVDVGVGPWTTNLRAVGLHINFVRISVAWSDVQPQSPHGSVASWNEVLLGKLDREVRLFERANVNVLIDLHQNGWSSYFDPRDARYGSRGIPAWFYAGTGMPATPAGQARAEAEFWTTDAARSALAYEAFADMIVERYRAFPNVLGYEVLNEPPPGSLGSTHAATTAILRWQARVAASMRGFDPYRTIFIMGQSGGAGLGTAAITAFRNVSNIGLDFHDYFNGVPGGGFSGSGDTWYPSWSATHMQATRIYRGTFAAQLGLLRVPLRVARAWGVPLLVGEWGDKETTVGGEMYQTQMLHVFQALQLDWARWAMDRSGGFDLVGSGYQYNPQALQLRAYLDQLSTRSRDSRSESHDLQLRAALARHHAAASGQA